MSGRVKLNKLIESKGNFNEKDEKKNKGLYREKV
jgi:hypothetical protein